MMGINQYIKIGLKIKKARISKGIRQKDMAEKLGLSVSTYSNYENNYREQKLDIVEKICRILDMTIDELVDFPISNDESCMTDSLSYEQSHSYASSEEEFNKLQENRQIEFTKKNHSNVHKYDASIRIKPTSEQIEKYLKNAKAEELLKRQASGEKLTDEEYQEVSNYIEQTKEIYSEIRFKINNIFDSLNRISKRCLELENIQRQENIRILDKHLREIKSMMADQPDNQENLNDIGRQKVNDYIADLSNIPEYQKNNDPPQE